MIQIEELTKYYRDFCAVDGISLTIPRGEIVGLLGPNGAGKTTTLRILTCFLRPTSGRVTVKGFDIYDNPREIKSLIGYLPEAAPVYPDMLTYDYLLFVGDVKGMGKKEREKEIEKLVDMCGLEEVMHQPIHELSKGYKQRVGLAHAMMNDPEILILDEPTSGLDPNQIVEIRDIIREMGREKTVLISTHILSEAEAACDRIVIINRGSIVAEGATETLKQEAGKSYTVHLSITDCEGLEVEETLSHITGVMEVTRLEGHNGDLSFRLTCEGAGDARPDIYRAIRGKEWTLLDFHRETRTLETIFRELTKED